MLSFPEEILTVSLWHDNQKSRTNVGVKKHKHWGLPCGTNFGQVEL